MSEYFRYLWYIIRHKWYVMIECFKVGLFWRGITHDLSKLWPSELFPYMNWFSDQTMLDLRKKDLKDLSDSEIDLFKNREREFDQAWLRHQHRNDHHWQHWILHFDNRTTKVLEMPLDCAIEMMCDWIGAGMAITGKREAWEWYQKNKDRMTLHPLTRALVEKVLPEY